MENYTEFFAKHGDKAVITYELWTTPTESGCKFISVEEMFIAFKERIEQEKLNGKEK